MPLDLSPLEEDLDAWFKSKKRGVGTRIIGNDAPGEVRFLVQHGQPYKREPSRKGRQSICTFFRPERTGLVIIDAVNNELRVNTSSLAEIKLYRRMFGKHLFGDEEKFVYAEKYTLDPLKVFMALALQERGIEREAKIRRAKFKVKLEGQKRERSVVIRPWNVADYGRGEAALIIEEWLRARGFVLVGSEATECAEAKPARAGA